VLSTCEEMELWFYFWLLPRGKPESRKDYFCLIAETIFQTQIREVSTLENLLAESRARTCSNK
jgi:hypothetical protein